MEMQLGETGVNRETAQYTDPLICGLIQTMKPKNCETLSSEENRLISLVRQARSGDRAAFDQLVRLHHERIYRMVFFRSKKQMDAEDLCQEVFVRAFKSLPKLKEESKFTPWLYAIAGNTVRDYYRKRKILSLFQSEPDVEPEQDPDSHEAAQPLSHVLQQEFWAQVEKFSKNLSKWEKEIFFLRFMDQLTISEIVEATGKSASAVKTHLYRGIDKYRKQSGTFAKFMEDRHEQ
ncbi:RNA polymerase, sigma-24 subunit, ECF subfamily [Desulfatibacillum aliphaticivorans]|uniref:RNA polymerase, sigma-24 subunit, ECF subfamily n=1 Tax=Desulfatibacillum aliphaticivorans TaxID=218208 RepID=B8FNE9_DESAL|nr:RNA polymerase sigma factor [Desulfatibacillum aliphaticivorans]ACL06118.1 RNA polymerase, sigma-24 subunit, ECF subfamily [Desulfatibacillum aliphaticivorans]